MKNTDAVHLRSAVLIAFMILVFPRQLLSQGEIPVTTSSKEALALFNEGRAKQENLNFPAAAKLFDQALEKDPDFALANLYRSVAGGGAAITRPRLEKAVALADKVSPGERLQILASKASVDGDREGYKKYIDELLMIHPNDKRARYFMAGYYNTVGDDDNYVHWLNKTIEADMNFTPAYNQLGYAYKNRGKFKEAGEAFLKQIELAPAVGNTYDSYAELLLKWGKFDESSKYYQMALEKEPEFKTALRGIGLNHLHKGDFAKARESFERFYNESPQTNGKLDAIANIMYSYLHEWDIESAMKAADRYLQLAEKDKFLTAVVTNHIWRAWISLEAGKPDDAAGHLKMAKTANEAAAIPAGTKGNNEITLGLIQANVQSAKKDFGGARKQLEAMRELIEKRGISFEMENWHSTAGYLELMQGNYDKALELFQKVHPENVLNTLRKAKAYEGKGDAEQAKKAYQAVVNWNWTGILYALTRPQAMKKAM